MSAEPTRISAFTASPFQFAFGSSGYDELSVQDTIKSFSFASRSCKGALKYAEVYEKYKGVIPEGAFSGCGQLTSVRCDYIGSIGTRAFTPCSNLETVYITRTDAPTIGIDAFDGAKQDYVVWTGNDQYRTFRYDSSSGGKAAKADNNEWIGYIQHVSSLTQPKVTFVKNAGAAAEKIEVVNYWMDATPPVVVDEGGNPPKGWSRPYVDVTADITCTAEWKTKYDVKFDVQQKCEPPETVRIYEGFTVERPEQPQAVGYVFGDWYKTNAYETKWDFDNDTVQSDTTLWGSWAANSLTLEYDRNYSGAAEMQPQHYSYDEQITLSSAPVRKYNVTYRYNYEGGADPAAEEYAWTFGKWNDKADGAGAYSYSAGEQCKNPNGASSGSTKLWAKWADQTGVTLPSPTPPAKYESLGWYTAAEGGDKVGAFGASYVPTADLTAYAHWQKQTEITVTYTIETFGASPVVNTYIDGVAAHDPFTCSYGSNTFSFSVIGSHKARVDIGITDASLYAVFFNGGRVQDLGGMTYDIADDGTHRMGVGVHIMKLQSYLPYVASVLAYSKIDNNDQKLTDYLNAQVVNDAISAYSPVTAGQYRFIASPGKLLKGHKYQITMTSQYTDDWDTPGKIRIGHRGADTSHTMKFRLGLRQDGSDSVEYLDFAYKAQSSSTRYTTTNEYSFSGLSKSTKSIYLKPVDVDLTDKDANCEFGVVLRDDTSGCTGATLGGGDVDNTQLNYVYYTQSRLSTDLSSNITSTTRNRLTKTKIDIQITD